MLRTSTSVALLAATLFAASPCHAWQSEADNLSSAAAASVVLYSLCDLPQAPRIAEQTAEMLRSHAARMAAKESVKADEVAAYLLESANRKVNAFWVANEQRGCAGSRSLRAFAAAYQFPLPR